MASTPPLVSTVYPDPLVPDVRVAASAVLRIDPDEGIYIHANSSHAAIGIERTWVDGDGQLVVDHAQLGPVVAILCSPDETLVSRGIDVGGSGGGRQTRLRFSRGTQRLRLNVSADLALIESTVSNVWLAVLQVNQQPAVDTPTDPDVTPVVAGQ